MEKIKLIVCLQTKGYETKKFLKYHTTNKGLNKTIKFLKDRYGDNIAFINVYQKNTRNTIKI